MVQEIKQKTSMKYGFQLGGMMKIPFENKLYFAPSVFYSMKGYKATFTQYAFPPDLDAQDNDVTVHTFEICPMFHIDLGNDPGHVSSGSVRHLTCSFSARKVFTNVPMAAP